MNTHNFYGFNPFIVAVHQNDEGLLYDLLKAEVSQVPSYMVKIFDKSTYTAYDTLVKRLNAEGKDENELQSFLNEALESGIVLEFPGPYWRNEIQTSMETGFNSPEKTIPGEFFNVWLQPSGKCDRNCPEYLCNSHVNCGCISDNLNASEWSETELNNLLKDLKRYKKMLLGIYIHGGNPLLFPHLEKLLMGLNELQPLLIRLVIPAPHDLNNMNNLNNPKGLWQKVQAIKDHTGVLFKASYNIYPDYWNIEKLIKEIPAGSEINVLIDSNGNGNNGNVDLETLKKRGIKIRKTYLLKKDLSNSEWFKEKIRKDSFESVEYNEFFMRKHLHQCWGKAFAINSMGEVKPCLWSDYIFDSWKEGKVSHILVDDPKVSSFFRDNNLENIEGCKECIYRYGCKDCRVTGEFISKERKTKNPWCER